MPPIIIHHNDDDGRCAAAIVAREIIPIFNRPRREDCFEYKHGYKLIIPNETIMNATDIYIVDVAIDSEILNFVAKVVELRGDKMPPITLIDHHQSSKDWLEENTDPELNINKYVSTFVKMGLSATLLTWLYSTFTMEERKQIPDDFDFTKGYTHLAVHVGKREQREYRIPWAVRLINDWDVWNHELRETKPFNLGFSLLEDKHPMSDIWDSVIYGDERWLDKEYVQPGRIIQQYQERINERAIVRSFDIHLDGIKGLALNQPGGSSLTFGKWIKEYPFVCLFSYDGNAKLWKYSLYSDENNGVDVEKIAKNRCF